MVLNLLAYDSGMVEALLMEQAKEKVNCRFAEGDRVRSLVPAGLEGVVKEWWANGFGSSHRVYVVVQEENGNYFCVSQEHVELVVNRNAA